MRIGLSTSLFITFLVLKLTEVITWSWWLVTAPLWAPLALVVAFVTFCLTMAGLVALQNRVHQPLHRDR